MGRADRTSRRTAPSAGRDTLPAAASVGPSHDPPDFSRLGIPIRPDGTLAADRMRPTTREALRKIVTDPATAKALGVVEPVDAAGPQLPEGIGDALAHGIAAVDLAIVARITHAPPHMLDAIKWSELEIALIRGPLINVAQKYGGGWLGKFGDEIALAVLLISITQAKIEGIRSLMAQQPPTSTPRVVPFAQPNASTPDDAIDSLGGAPHNQPESDADQILP